MGSWEPVEQVRGSLRLHVEAELHRIKSEIGITVATQTISLQLDSATPYRATELWPKHENACSLPTRVRDELLATSVAPNDCFRLKEVGRAIHGEHPPAGLPLGCNASRLVDAHPT